MNTMTSCLSSAFLTLIGGMVAASSARAQTDQYAETAHYASAGFKPWICTPEGICREPLAGGLSTTDLTTFRMRYPAAFKADPVPHYHLGTEQFTVLKGTVHFGFGPCFKPEKAVAYGAGSFVEIPAGTPHFEWFEGEVEIQATFVGPSSSVKILDGCKPGEHPELPSHFFNPGNQR